MFKCVYDYGVIIHEWRSGDNSRCQCLFATLFEKIYCYYWKHLTSCPTRLQGWFCLSLQSLGELRFETRVSMSLIYVVYGHLNSCPHNTSADILSNEVYLYPKTLFFFGMYNAANKNPLNPHVLSNTLISGDITKILEHNNKKLVQNVKPLMFSVTVF